MTTHHDPPPDVAETPRFQIRPHEGGDRWLWEVFDTKTGRIIELCTFHRGAEAICDQLNEGGYVDV